MLAYNGPYGLGPSLRQPSRNRHAAYYADKELKSFPRREAHPWLHGNKVFLNDVGAMRRYAAEVSGVDDGVGRVMDTLREHGLDEPDAGRLRRRPGMVRGAARHLGDGRPHPAAGRVR